MSDDDLPGLIEIDPRVVIQEWRGMVFDLDDHIEILREHLRWMEAQRERAIAQMKLLGADVSDVSASVPSDTPSPTAARRETKAEAAERRRQDKRAKKMGMSSSG